MMHETGVKLGGGSVRPEAGEPVTITEFLLARIAEDEAVAQAAGHQKVAGPFHGRWVYDSLFLARSGLEIDDRRHIARHDPERVLAECKAKRAIIDEFTKIQAGDFSTWLSVCEPEYGAGVTAALRNVVQVIALTYADHPDYDEAWRP